MRQRENDNPKRDKWAVRPRRVIQWGQITEAEKQPDCLAIVKAVGLGELTLEEADRRLADILGHHVLPQV